MVPGRDRRYDRLGLVSRTPAELSDADYQALAAFRRTLRLFLTFSERAARGAGITPAQHQLLLAVRGHTGNGAPTTTDVADSLQLRLHSAGELVGRAEANGLIVRLTDPTDHRRTLLELTPEGAACLSALTADHRAELTRFRSEMTAVLDALDP